MGTNSDRVRTPLSDDEKRLYAVLDQDIRPYLRDRNELLSRLQRLVNLAKAVPSVQVSHSGVPEQIERDDILRSVVVLNHAYLEDFLRTLSRHFLPLAERDVLNEVPLVGTNDRLKFQLGDLSQHLGKSVGEVIRESVDQHLERSTFNSTDDIASLLRKLRFDISRHEEFFPALDAMIRRRHTIVHRADRAAKGDGQYEVLPIKAEQVLGWVLSTHGFMNSVLSHVSVMIHWKRYCEIYGDPRQS